MNTLSAAQAVEALMQEYGKLVFHTIYGLTGDWEESQDLTQDTFQQALKGIDAAREARGEQFQPRAWLLRIALNTVRMQHRRKVLFSFLPFSHLLNDNQGSSKEQGSLAEERLHEQAMPVQPPGYGTRKVEDPADVVAERDAVQRTMARLPEVMRVVLLLSIIGGLSSSEIAQTLQIKEPAVRQRLARARKQFQEIYLQENRPERMSDRPLPLQTVSEKATDTEQEDAAHRYPPSPAHYSHEAGEQTSRGKESQSTAIDSRQSLLRRARPGTIGSSNG